MELTILMPCLNEIQTIAQCINEAYDFLTRSGVEGEVLVSDNGSTDGSVELALSLGARVVHADIRGYGGALQAGIEAAKGRYVIMADSDASYDFGESGEFLRLLREGADMVIGSRYSGGFEKGAMPFSHRYIGVPVLSFLGRIASGSAVKDFHCGLRAVNRERFLTLGAHASGMEYASEMIILAAKAGHIIRQTPVHLRCDRRDKPPHLRTIPDGFRHLKLIFSLAFRN